MYNNTCRIWRWFNLTFLIGVSAWVPSTGASNGDRCGWCLPRGATGATRPWRFLGWDVSDYTKWWWLGGRIGGLVFGISLRDPSLKLRFKAPENWWLGRQFGILLCGYKACFQGRTVGFREGITFLGVVKLKGMQLKKQELHPSNV